MKKIALSFLVMLVSAGAVFAQSDLQALAIVKYNKSETITLKQVKTRCENYEKQNGRKLTVDERTQVLETLIQEKLMLQAAAKAGLSIPDSTVNQYFLRSMSQQVGASTVLTEKELNDITMKAQGKTLDALLLEQTGMNMAESKTFIKNSLIIQQYVLSQKQAELQKVAPTDDQIRQFYESNKTSFVWNDMIKLFVLAVPKDDDADKAKSKINELRNKIANKSLTLEQAEVQAKNENSGYRAQSGLVQKTEAWATQFGMTYSELLALFEQPEGFLTDVKDVDGGYYVFRVGKKYDAKMLKISDLVQPETTVTVYDFIRQGLTQQLQQQYLQLASEEMVKELNVSENVDRKKTGDELKKLLSWGN